MAKPDRDNGSSQYVVLSDTGTPGVYNSTYAAPDDFLWEGLTGHLRSNSDIHVSADKALTFAPWFQGISIISGDVARVPLDPFSRAADDDRNKERNHPAYELLNRQANRYMSSFTVRETLQSLALSWGNGYAGIIWQGAKPVELIPIMSDELKPYQEPGGPLVYLHRQPGGETKVLSAENVLHIRGLGTALEGYSVYRYARESLGLGLAAQRHGSRHFANDARPSILLKYPARLEPQDADELLDNWERRHKNNPNRPALLAGGLDAVPLEGSNEDSQWIESRGFSRDEVASWLALPPHKLGSTARLSYNSVEAEERSYVSQTLMRWFKRWESECDIKLLAAKEKRAWWYFEHNTGALIQGDFTTQSSVAVMLKNAMIITKNEARKKFNLNGVEGGDVFENSNTSSGAKTEPDPPPAKEPTSDESVAAHVELIVDRMRQLVRTEKTKITELAHGKCPAEAIDKWYKVFEPKVAAAMSMPMRAYSMVAPCEISSTVLSVRYCRASRDFLRHVIESATCDPSYQVATAIEAAVDDWPETRPQLIVHWIRKG
jgi:HK97 family phage portal protein